MRLPILNLVAIPTKSVSHVFILSRSALDTFFVLDGPVVGSPVDSGVFLTADQHKILGSVIESVVVDVMDEFRSQKFPSKFLLHDNPMLIRPSTGRSNFDLPVDTSTMSLGINASASNWLRARIVHTLASNRIGLPSWRGIHSSLRNFSLHGLAALTSCLSRLNVCHSWMVLLPEWRT